MRHFIYVLLWVLGLAIENMGASQLGGPGGMLPPQPIIINGGAMPALNIFHQPINLPTVLKNSLETFKNLQDLQNLNQKIEREMAKREGAPQQPSAFLSEMSQAAVMSAFGSKSMLGDDPSPVVSASPDIQSSPIPSQQDPSLGQPNIQQKITVGDSTDTQQLEMEKGTAYHHDFQKLSSVLKNNRFKSITPTRKCESKSGFLKIKSSQDTGDVPLYYCILNRGSLAYFKDAGQMGSFEGALVLKEIQEMKIMNGHPQCFYLLAGDENKSVSACAQNEMEAGEWVGRLQDNQAVC